MARNPSQLMRDLTIMCAAHGIEQTNVALSALVALHEADEAIRITLDAAYARQTKAMKRKLV